jgi:transcriptional regulator GlxA family with amidase domain
VRVRGSPRENARRIGVIAYPGLPLLDVTSMVDIFSRANARILARRRGHGYTVDLIGPTPGPVMTATGISLMASHGLLDATGAYDTLFVAGGATLREEARSGALSRWLGPAAKRARRVSAICRGIFALGELGLLDGRRVTTHWASSTELAEAFPSAIVEPEPLFVRDGSLYTSAGATGALDLALAFIEQDHGRDLALELARELVLYVRRPGGQPQLSAQLSAQLASRSPIRSLQGWILENLNDDLSVPALARRVGMSPRNFSRVFAREVGETPRQFVQSARIETARRFLEDTGESVDVIAALAGFPNADTLRREFTGSVGVPPTAYRRDTKH